MKNFSIEMEVKNTGMELTVYSADGKTQLGDLYVNKKEITWCRGKTSRGNGKALSWKKFIDLVENA